MRILVISHLFPPCHSNAEALDGQDIVESLKNRRHPVRILTSECGPGQERAKNYAQSIMKMDFEDETDWKVIFLKELVNQTVFKRTCFDFEPDVCLFFDLSRLSLSLFPLALEMGLPVCFYYANNWFVTREKDRWFRLWPKGEEGFRVLRYLTHRFGLLPPPITLPSSHSIFASRYLKKLGLECGVATPEAPITPCGVDIHRFPYQSEEKKRPHHLLYSGRIHPECGIPDVMEALFLLGRRYGENALSLTIAGDVEGEPGYERYLKDLADKWGLKERMNFLVSVPPKKMPDLYRSHSLFIFPCYRDDSPTRPLLEAMSSGLAVVSTRTAANAEILENDVNARLYPRGDAAACAEQILCLIRETEVWESIRKNARITVEKRYQLSHSVDVVEQYLQRIDERTDPVRDPGGTQPESGLDLLIRRAKRWLFLGRVMVFARIVFRPKFFMQILVKAYKKLMCFTPHFLYKIFFDAYFFLKGHRRKNADLSPLHKERILVVQLADIGDVVLTSPFLRELRKLHPNAWISLAVKPGMLNLVEKCPYVDTVLPFDWGPPSKREEYLRGSPKWWIQATRYASQNFWAYPLDMAVSVRWNDDPCQAASLILMYTSGAVRRVAYKAASPERMRYGWKDLERLISEGPAKGMPKHEVDQQLDILRYLGGEPGDTRLEIWTSLEDEKYAQNILIDSGILQAQGVIAFAPGAAWPFRRWPPKRFIELGQWLQGTYDVSIVILAAEEEAELAHRIENGLQSGRTINLAGKTTLREMAAVLENCHLFIGNDSGPLHIATAAGIPVLGFYGPGEYHRFKPWGKNHEVLRLGLSCSPCSQNCVFGEPRCILGIDLDQAQDLLAKKMPTILDLP